MTQEKQAVSPLSLAPAVSAAGDNPWRLIGIFGGLLSFILIGYLIAGFLLARHDERHLIVVAGSVNPGFTDRDCSEPAAADEASGDGGLLSASQRLEGTKAKTDGQLEISLLWDSTSDLDLSVVDPLQSVVDGYNSHSRGGGVLDVDANPTPMTEEGSRLAVRHISPGAAAQLPIDDSYFDGKRLADPPNEGIDRPVSIYTHSPIEHINFVNAPKGIYEVRVHCYSWRERNRNPLPFRIQVRSNGILMHEVTGRIGPESFVANGTVPTVAFKLEIR